MAEKDRFDDFRRIHLKLQAKILAAKKKLDQALRAEIDLFYKRLDEEFNKNTMEYHAIRPTNSEHAAELQLQNNQILKMKIELDRYRK